MKYFKIIFLLFFIVNSSLSQELYINTEPASLIPKGTKVVRVHHHTIFLNDINECDIQEIKSVANGLNITLDWVWKNNLDIEFDRKFDLTFIDTWHVYGQLKRELAKFAKLTKKYILSESCYTSVVYANSLYCIIVTITKSSS